MEFADSTNVSFCSQQTKFRANLPRISLSRMCFLLLIVPVSCDFAFMTMPYEPASSSSLVTFSFNETYFIRFYKCLVNRYNTCKFKYEPVNNQVTSIEGTSNMVQPPHVYTCTNNASILTVKCSIEQQANCTFDGLENTFAILWNNTHGEYFEHPDMMNSTQLCLNQLFTIYNNITHVSTTATTPMTTLQYTTSISSIYLSKTPQSTLHTTTTKNAESLIFDNNQLFIILVATAGIAFLVLLIVTALIVKSSVDKIRSKMKLPITTISLTNTNPSRGHRKSVVFPDSCLQSNDSLKGSYSNIVVNPNSSDEINTSAISGCSNIVVHPNTCHQTNTIPKSGCSNIVVHPNTCHQTNNSLKGSYSNIVVHPNLCAKTNTIPKSGYSNIVVHPNSSDEFNSIPKKCFTLATTSI